MSDRYDITPDGDIAVSTRVRLARNLEGIPFPSKMSAAERRELNGRVKAALLESNTPFAKSLKYIDMKSVPENEIAAMVERHTVSPEFAADPSERAVILSADESISIMVGEEDHIRIQVILGGLQLEKAYDTAETLDRLLYDSLHFAFDKDLGFLTECPTNLGTGMRASVMLHLPVTESNGEIAAVSDTVGKIGFTVRGMYGEGSKSAAAMYQVSNQITLGISEKNAVDNLKIITGQLIAKERESRAALDRIKAEDICGRAYGILTNCRLLSSEEMMKLLSAIKLGIGMGILDIKADPVKLIIEGQPHMLMKRYGTMNAQERDICRADFIKEQLTKV
ncbi:MAG TPA: ATP--guanido phosphotransferase [Ruminococcaceae bacterium]|nr:ATP--guanido phosphotransferase [Oscillospiraceae bacterium]